MLWACWIASCDLLCPVSVVLFEGTMPYPTPPRPTNAARAPGFAHLSCNHARISGRSTKSGSGANGTVEKGLRGRADLSKQKFSTHMPSPAVAPTVCWRVSQVEVCCPAGCGVSSGYHDTAIDRPVENTCWHHLHPGSATESRVCPKSRMESRSARTKSHCGLGGAERAWSLVRLDWAARSAGRPPVLPSSQLFSLTPYTLVQQHQRH
jgi:hypothetical protein